MLRTTAMGSRFLVKVTYPLGAGQIVLRSDADWAVDVAPSAIAGGTSAFEFASDKYVGFMVADAARLRKSVSPSRSH